MDITVFHNGYHGDLNETFFVGEVDEGAKRLVQTTYECLMQAIDAGKREVHFALALYDGFRIRHNIRIQLFLSVIFCFAYALWPVEVRAALQHGAAD